MITIKPGCIESLIHDLNKPDALVSCTENMRKENSGLLVFLSDMTEMLQDAGHDSRTMALYTGLIVYHLIRIQLESNELTENN